jgi:hypothetical protein
MLNCYSVSLPVKPYVLKYVQTVEGSPQLRFESSSMLCMIVRAYIENKNYIGLSQQQFDAAISTRTATLKIVIPGKQMYKVGTSIRPDGIVMINRFLEEWFERALVKFMNDNTRKCGRYKGFKEAYYAFAKLYNVELEKDITIEGLKKMDYRLRRKKEDDNDNKNGFFFSTLVPSL